MQNIKSAAVAMTYVTQLYYEEFIAYTNQWYYQYQQYLALNPSSPQSTGQDPITTAWLAVATAPAQQTVYAVDVFIKQLRNDGNLLLDYFYLFAQDQQVNATINIVNPFFYQATEQGTPTWSANLGYTGNGSSMFLQTNFIDSTNGVYATLNSESMGVYTRQTVTAATKYVMGAYDGTHYDLFGINEGSNGLYLILSSNGGITDANSNTKGCFSAVRTSSTATAIWMNGVSATSGSAIATALCSKQDYIMAYNNNGAAAGYDTNQYTCAWKGSGAINQVLFNSAVNTLMTNIGAHY